MGQYNAISKKLIDYFKCAFCSNEQNLDEIKEQFQPNEKSYENKSFRLVCWYCFNCWELNICRIDDLYKLNESLVDIERSAGKTPKVINDRWKTFKEKDISKFNKIVKKYKLLNEGITLHQYNANISELNKWWRFCRFKNYKVSNYFNLPRNKTIDQKNVPQKLRWVLNEYQDNLALNNRTAMAMLARKILLYLWHDECTKNGSKYDDNLSFAKVCDELKNSDLLGKNQNADFDKIRKIGNEANHNIVEISDEQSIILKRIIDNLINAIYYE